LALSTAFRESRALASAVELGVFTALSSGALDGEQLRERLGLHARGARDFFDALVALGLLQRDASGFYSNSPDAAAYLDENRPEHLCGFVRYAGQQLYSRWTHLTESLRSGDPVPERAAQGGSRAHFESAVYLSSEAVKSFAAAMSSGSLASARALAQRFPWNQYRTFADIGCSEGCLPAHVAQAHAHLSGIGFDLPPLQASFDEYIAARDLSKRVRFVPGDFMKDALPGADVLVFGRVLHNWDLPTKLMLLRKAYAALPENGAAVIYERLIDDERRTHASGLLGSLNMLVSTPGGFDFSAADCFEWMRAAGFRETRVEPLTRSESMVIGIK
jgi:SAM-dependent methyltransferase